MPEELEITSCKVQATQAPVISGFLLFGKCFVFFLIIIPSIAAYADDKHLASDTLLKAGDLFEANGIDFENLTVTRLLCKGNKTIVCCQQSRKGLPVFDSQVSFVLDLEGRLILHPPPPEQQNPSSIDRPNADNNTSGISTQHRITRQTAVKTFQQTSKIPRTETETLISFYKNSEGSDELSPYVLSWQVSPLEIVLKVP